MVKSFVAPIGARYTLIVGPRHNSCYELRTHPKTLYFYFVPHVACLAHLQHRDMLTMACQGHRGDGEALA